MNFNTLTKAAFTASLTFFSLSGCDPYDPNLGNVPFRCSNDVNPQCPEGFDCVIQNEEGDKFCVAQTQLLPPEGSTPENSGLICTPDDEPTNNDSRANAVLLTPASSTRIGSICPNIDVDFYSFQVFSPGTSLDVTLSYATDFGALQMDVQRSTDLEPLASGVPFSVEDDFTSIQATASGLSEGLYFIVVSPVGNEPVDENNYTITLNLQ